MTGAADLEAIGLEPAYPENLRDALAMAFPGLDYPQRSTLAGRLLAGRELAVVVMRDGRAYVTECPPHRIGDLVARIYTRDDVLAALA